MCQSSNGLKEFFFDYLPCPRFQSWSFFTFDLIERTSSVIPSLLDDFFAHHDFTRFFFKFKKEIDFDSFDVCLHFYWVFIVTDGPQRETTCNLPENAKLDTILLQTMTRKLLRIQNKASVESLKIEEVNFVMNFAKMQWF